MKSIVELMTPKYQGCIVEIGAGSSTYILNKIAVKFKRKFYSCDVKDKPKEILSKYHIKKIMPSTEFMNEFNETPMFVLLDGNHKFENVRKEFYFFYERLTPGGAIFMHDTMPPSEAFLRANFCNDAYKLRLELEKDANIEIVTFQYPLTLVGQSMVIKRNRKDGYSPPGEHYDY